MRASWLAVRASWLAVVTTGLLACTAPTFAAGVDPIAVADDVVQRTNAFRREQAREPLKVNAELMSSARDFVQFMARTDRYGHEADGSDPGQRAKNHGYEMCAIGENIAFQFSSTGFESIQLARALVEGWKNSPEHRRNMLEPGMSDTGAAVAQSAKSGRWYAVQLFGLPWTARVMFRVTNEAPASVRYRVANRTYDIAPNVTRTHERCGAAEVVFDWPDQPASKAEAQNGGHLALRRDGSGAWRVEEK